MVAMTLAEDAADKTGALIAAPLYYGFSPHHMVLPGTCTVRPEILTELLYDITSSLAEHGVTRFVYLNGHRIVNVIWMQVAAERAQRTLGVKVAIFDPAWMSKEIVDKLGFGPLGHAEEIESSHMYYRHPELCKPERAIDNPPHEQELYSVDPRYTKDTLCYVPSTRQAAMIAVKAAKGTTGSPTKASGEKGKKYHDHLVERLTAVIKTLRDA
jgi:creatinine amidohydrolase